MKDAGYFDVLTIIDNQQSVDLVQAILREKCLGTFLQNGFSKLYFNSGLRREVDIKLEELLPDQNTQWIWETLANEDWHLAWQDHFKPIVINNKLAVIPYWDDNIHAEFTIKIKPGMAFGTGHHETTWLVLRHMLKYVTSGSSVLDLGTGSGILSIAAMQLGAEIVDAVEQDSACESNFYENLKLNEITEGIQYHNGDVLTWNQLDYNLILANINRSVIEQLIPRLKSFKGKILLSGILESEYQNIEKLCYYNSFQVKERMIKGEWVCLVIE